MEKLIKRLDKENINFPLKTRSKKPFIKDWPNHKSQDTIRELLAADFNYGLRTGVKLGHYYFCALDFDKKGNYSKFPFISYVKTANGRHVYLLIKELPPKHFLYYQGEKVGELQSKGHYVVGFGSTHPTGKKYKFVERGKWFWKLESIEELKEKLKKQGIILK